MVLRQHAERWSCDSSCAQNQTNSPHQVFPKEPTQGSRVNLQIYRRTKRQQYEQIRRKRPFNTEMRSEMGLATRGESRELFFGESELGVNGQAP
jgi:hypothetical protein